MNRKRNSFSLNKLFSTLILVVTLFMGIGYASVNSVLLEIAGTVQADLQDGIFITDVVYDSSIVADYENSKIIYAHQTMLNSNIILSEIDQNSSITYEITIYNSNADDYVYVGPNYLLSDETYSNEDIVFKLNGLAVGDILESKESVTFTITFYYNNNQLMEDNTLNSIITFDFDKIYYVTYENFSSTSGYPAYVIEGDTLSISFGTLGAPIEVKKSNVVLSSSDYSYSNYVLTLNNVDGDIHIRKLTKYTITNLVTNGSFENGFNGWSLSGTSGSWGTFNANYFGNVSAYRIASSEGSNFLRQNIYWNSGHKYYYFGYGISVTQQLLACNITNKGGKFTVTTIPTELRKGASLYTADFTGYNTISINYAATTDNINVDGIGLVDLTATFGVGNEPSLEWCNANINYFDESMTIYK